MTTLPPRKVTEQAAAWYLDYRDGLDERQQHALAQWLRSSPAHAREYAAIAALHDDVAAAARAQDLAADELARAARAEGNVLMLPILPRRQAPPRPRRGAGRLRRFAVAACAVVALCAALGPLALDASRAPPGRQYATDAGGTRRIVLEDGTWMQLDRGSAVSVRFDGHRRLVEVLRGQALFDIGHGDRRPFLVQAGRALLQDIGTVFDVGVSAGGAAVTVVQGRVFLWQQSPHWFRRWRGGGGRLPAADGADFLADLRAGQQGRVDLGGALLSAGQADVDSALAWLPGDIRFERETVAEVARRFNAYTSIPLEVGDPALAARRITGVFHARDQEAFLAYLKTFPGVRVVREGERVRIVVDRHGSAPAPAPRARRG